MKSRIGNEGGFSLVEVIVALVILSVGLLSMAATTGYVATQVRAGDLRTERAEAMQQVIEGLRTVQFDNLDTRDQTDAITVGDFQFWWTVTRPNANLAQVDIVSVSTRALPDAGHHGAARTHGAVAQDTFSITLARP